MMEKKRGGVRWFVLRHRELLVWLPVLTVLAVGGVVILGGLSAGLGPDLLSWLAELPVYSAYGFAALGLSYLAWRRWRVELTKTQLDDLWGRLLDGQRGAVIVHVVNAVFYLAVLWLALDFFKPPR